MPINNVLFSNATVKSLENKCLNVDRINRFIDSANINEAKKVLVEIGYDGINSASMISNELSKTYELLKNTSPNEQVTSSFLKKNDYHNAKVIIKAKYTRSTTFEEYLYPIGNLEIIELKDKIFSDNYVFLPSLMTHALQKIDLAFASGDKSPILIDYLLNQAMYEDIFSVLSNKYNKVKEFFSAEVDILNISTAVRMRLYQLPVKSFKAQFIQGGLLTENVLSSFVECSIDNILESLKYTPYLEIGKALIEDLLGSSGLVLFETASDKQLMSYFTKHKFDSQTFMPFYGFIVGKLFEIKNVRIIMSCIENNLDKSQIKVRLRSQYV